jgi:hypothetical protein
LVEAARAIQKLSQYFDDANPAVRFFIYKPERHRLATMGSRSRNRGMNDILLSSPRLAQLAIARGALTR